MGLSQLAVARALLISQQQLNKYENGDNAMNATRLYQFGQFLRVPVEYFFEGLEEPHASSDRESVAMMRAFQAIANPLVRKRLADMVRALSAAK